ncbi:MAG: glycosyltransferase family 2 protein [Bernardetiaceae bacterium]|nr:glycosyltransferase family 2 protein [Bernardetiaceae bacterium]
MPSPKVVISVLNWNNWQATETCLKAVRQQTYAHWQIVVVDNASKYIPKSFCRDFPEVTLLQLSKNQGYAGGHLATVRWTRKQNFDLLWILNNDAIPQPDALAALVEAWQEQPDALYGSITLQADGTINYGGGSLVLNNQIVDGSYNPLYGLPYETVKEQLVKRPVGELNGASLLIPFHIIRKYGFIDTRYFLYCEETDYCHKLWRVGIPSFVIPQSVVVHQGAVSFTLNRSLEYVRTYYRTRNQLLLDKKYRRISNKIIRKELADYLDIADFFIRHYVHQWFGRTSHHTHEYYLRYFRILATFHALVGIRGKYVAPEKFLHPTD